MPSECGLGPLTNRRLAVTPPTPRRRRNCALFARPRFAKSDFPILGCRPRQQRGANFPAGALHSSHEASNRSPSRAQARPPSPATGPVLLRRSCRLARRVEPHPGGSCRQLRRHELRRGSQSRGHECIRRSPVQQPDGHQARLQHIPQGTHRSHHGESCAPRQRAPRRVLAPRLHGAPGNCLDRNSLVGRRDAERLRLVPRDVRCWPEAEGPVHHERTCSQPLPPCQSERRRPSSPAESLAGSLDPDRATGRLPGSPRLLDPASDLTGDVSIASVRGGREPAGYPDHWWKPGEPPLGAGYGGCALHRWGQRRDCSRRCLPCRSFAENKPSRVRRVSPRALPKRSGRPIR